MKKPDLRTNEWREAIVKISNSIENCELTTRALSILIADSCDITMTQATAVLKTIPKLKDRYLKTIEDKS